MSKVLFATHVEFWRENKGSSLRISSLVSYLCDHDIHVSVYFAGFVDKNTIDFIHKKYRNLNFFADNFFYSYSRSRCGLKILKKIVGVVWKRHKRGYFFGVLQPPGFSKKYAFYRRKYFNKIMKSVEPNHIVIEYIFLAYLIDRVVLDPNRPNLLVDTHDILHLRSKSFAASGLKQGVNISRDAEIFYLSKFDVILSIQSKEKKTLKNMLPGKNVLEVPYAYPARPMRKTKTGPLHIGYVGASSRVNQITVKEFITNVWIPLRTKYGDSIVFDVYGSICDDLLGMDAPKGVCLKGKFANLDEVYGSLSVIVNPVKAGSGLKIKNVEALCYSLPLVTTPCGAQGLESGMNDAFICCATNEQQLENLCCLIESEQIRNKFSKKAYEYASQNFGRDKCYSALLKVLC